jgi:cytochrome oxidase Cu insertion factor (SCO1/SenC/PrrC family)
MKIRPRHVALAVLALALVVFGSALTARWMREADQPVAPLAAAPAAALEDFGRVPGFRLIERSGRTVSIADLAGRIWIASFIYTRCTDTCPMQTARMAKLQDAFATEPGVRFLSISVDPEYDTPAILRAYAKKFGAHAERWLFLTGDKGTIHTLVRRGFHLAVEESTHLVTMPAHGPARPAVAPATRAVPARAGLFAPAPAFAHDARQSVEVVHSSWFVLLDREARIRGFYPSDDPEGLRRLTHDIRGLLGSR